MKTQFNWFGDDWKRIKNHCRTTDNKSFTGNEVTETFKQKLLISEHSPIRLLEFDWSWKSIYYWLSTEWSRHKFEKFISSQRDDRLVDETPRGKKPQDALVNFDGYANMQNLIDAWRKRLCFTATKEARELAEDFKIELHKTHPLESNVLVPNCIYRGGCPEFQRCGYLKGFLNWCKENDVEFNFTNIQQRYDLYNEYFYKKDGEDWSGKMFNYGEHIDLDRVTLQDCIDLCEKKEISSVINDGRIINFEKEGE